MLLVVCVAQVLQVELLHGLRLLLLLLLLLLSAGPRLLEAVQLLVVVLAQWRRLLAWLVLVGLAEWIRRKPLVQRQFAGVQRDALWEGSAGSAPFFIYILDLFLRELEASDAAH